MQRCTYKKDDGNVDSDNNSNDNNEIEINCAESGETERSTSKSKMILNTPVNEE